MAYRQTDRMVRKLAARREAILGAACATLAESGIAAVQIAAIADRAGIACGTVYRYFPSKTELVAAVVETLCEEEVAALSEAASAAPGPLSALAAALATFTKRAIARRPLVLALMASPLEAELEGVLLSFRRALAHELEKLIGRALAAGSLQHQEAPFAAPALLGGLIEGAIGPLAPRAGMGPEQTSAHVQQLTLLALRALGVSDARARGLVLQMTECA